MNLKRMAYEALEAAKEVYEEFDKRHGRPPSELEGKLAITFLLERIRETKRANGNGNGNGKQDAPTPGAPEACPDCGGPIWDNRSDKAAGKFGPKYPDFKCRDKTCDWAGWEKRKKAATKPAPAPAHARAPFDDEDDDLPFD